MTDMTSGAQRASNSPRTCAQQCKIGRAKNDQLAELLAVGVWEMQRTVPNEDLLRASKDLATARLLWRKSAKAITSGISNPEFHEHSAARLFSSSPS